MSDQLPSGPTAHELSNAALIRRLVRLGWRYRSACLKVLGFQVVLLALGLIGLGLTGVAIDFIRWRVQPGSPEPRWPFHLAPPSSWPPLAVIGAIAGAVLGMALLRAALNYFYQISAANLVHARIVVDLRTQVYDKMQRLSFRFFDANASSSLINRVTGDVQQLRMFVDGVMIGGAILVLSLVVYLAYMLCLDVPLTLACLATTPVMYLASSAFSRVMRPAYRRNRELYDAMVTTVSESAQGISVTKGFAREDDEIARFAAANRALRDQQQRIFWRISLFSPTIDFLTHVNLVIVLAYGGWLVLRGELALGTGLWVFIGLLQQFSGQVSALANMTNTVQQSLIGARRVFEVLDAPIEVRSRLDARALPQPKGAVRFERVSFAYQPGQPVLEEVSFAVEPGQCVAILGATGSGKSTALSLVPRFYDPTTGRILIDGVDLREVRLEDLRRGIGMVFQETFLFSNTVAANIAFGHPEATREQVERAARIASADEFIRALPKGYDTLLGESAMNLSGGQRQRLAIARAVLLEPSILLLDDPTAAIDPKTEHEILEAMEGAIAGRTTFVVANRISTLRRADLILVLDNGRIVERGSHDELMASETGHYRRVAKLQLIDAESQKLLEMSEGKG